LIEEKPEERRKRERKGEGEGDKVGEEKGEISSQNVLSFQEAKDALPRHLKKHKVPRQ
jgi:hypothetical protein